MYDTLSERHEFNLYDEICRIAYNKASLKLWDNYGRLNTASQHRWYMSESTSVIPKLGLEGHVVRQASAKADGLLI